MTNAHGQELSMGRPCMLTLIVPCATKKVGCFSPLLEHHHTWYQSLAFISHSLHAST